MKQRPTSVLDNGALLALVGDEPGSARVERAIRDHAAMSILNWTEALSKLARRGDDPTRLEPDLRDMGVNADALRIVPLDRAEGDRLILAASRLHGLVERIGIGLSDCICVALGRHLGLRVLTTDGALTYVELGVKIEHIRPERIRPPTRRQRDAIGAIPSRALGIWYL